MRKIWILVAMVPLLFSSLSAGAQLKYLSQSHYIKPFAIGLRGSPSGIGISGKFYFNDFFFLDAQYNWGAGTSKGLESGPSKMTVLMINYNTMIAGPDTRFFLGAGAHYGKWVRYRDKSKPEGMFGFDLIAGLEQAFRSIPMTASIDFKPGINYTSGVTFFPNNSFGIGLRYFFGEWRWYHPKRRDNRE